MSSLLTFAEELERRDADASAALLDAARLRREVEELRTQAAACRAFLAALPAALAERDADERAAAAERVRAGTRLREAEAAVDRARKDDERLAAERDLQQAGDTLRSAERWIEQAAEARARLEAEAEKRRREAERLTAAAAELAPRVYDVPAPAAGLEGAAAWASQARGALIVVQSGLERERDALAREADELVASVLGEATAPAGAAGVRERLARALDGE